MMIKWKIKRFFRLLNEARLNIKFQMKATKYERILSMTSICDFDYPNMYIGDVKHGLWLIEKGIDLESLEALPGGKTACIGFNRKEQKWYGWSHRAYHEFGIGDVVKEGSTCSSSGYLPEYLKVHPEKDLSLPVGFVAKTLLDAKKMAIAYADSVS